MKYYYVGTRVEHREISRLVGTSLKMLNERLSKNLRSTVLNKGIRKTLQGQKLLFYYVDEEQYIRLISGGVNVLVKVDSEHLAQKIEEVNTRYPSRMDYSTSLKYKSDLEKQFMDTVEIVGKDDDIRIKRKQMSDYLGGNTKLGKLIYNTNGHNSYLGEVGEFFKYIFHKGYVVGFSYSSPNEGMKTEGNMSKEYYEWKNNISPSDEDFEEYEKCFRYLIQLSRGDKWSRIYLSEENGIFSSSNGYSNDGYSHHYSIETNQSLDELYKQFVRVPINTIIVCNYVMGFYSSYETYGDFFSEYSCVTWDEVYDVIEYIYRPILMDTEGEFNFDTIDREKVRDILLSKRGRGWLELEHGLWVKKYILKEEVSKQDILDMWWSDTKQNILYINPSITDEELMKEKEVFDEKYWGSDSRLEYVYESLNTPSVYQKVG